MKTDLSGIIGQIKGWLLEITAVCLLLLLAMTALRTTGLVNINALRTIGPTELAYLCGALWLLKK